MVNVKPRVVHCKREVFDVYVGRPSMWGNPFSHKDGTLAAYKVASLEESLQRHEEWVMSQPDLVEAIKSELKGKTLGCWCAPKRCHGDILLRIANDEP